MKLAGIFAPLITPFGNDGSIDGAGFASNIKAHLADGVAGVVVAGSTGEAALLDRAERLALVERARREVPSSHLVLAGTGQESTDATIALTKDAAARGAGAALVVAPHYYGAAVTPHALRVHYEALADASPIPIVLYTIPKYMHFATPAEIVSALAKHENIIGIKDSSGNRELIDGYLASASPAFSVLTGSAALLSYALDRGAAGGILGVSLFAGSLAIELFRAHKRGEADEVARLQEPVSALNKRIVSELGVAGVKAALDAVGLVGGPLRAPLTEVTADVRAEIADMLRAVELTAA